MTDHDRSVLDLLDRASDGPTVEPPIQSIVQAGRQRQWRRHMMQIGATVAVTAVVIAGAVAVAYPQHHPISTSPPAFHGTVNGPSAAQLANGHWVKIPNASIRLCDPSYVSIGTAVVALSEPYDGGASVPSCRGAAALYDPRTNHWRAMPAPAYTTNHDRWIAAWSGDRLLLVSALNGVTQSWQPGARNWEQLQTLPMSGASSITWTGNEFVVNAVDQPTENTASQAATFALRQGSWKLLASLPAPRVGFIAAAPLVAFHGALYVLTNIWVQHTNPGDTYTSGRVELLRLAGGRWSVVPLDKGSPKTQLELAVVDDAIFAAGSRCPAAVCTLEGATAALIRPGTTHASVSPLVPPSRFFPYPYDMAAGGSVVVMTYPPGGNGNITVGSTPPDGSTELVDTNTGKWFAGPTESRGNHNIDYPILTRYGVFTDGWLLRPGKR